MVIFRCTQKLAKKFNINLEKDVSENSSNLLGDWYFNYFTFERKYFLLGISEKSLLPIIISAKEFKSFPERFCSSLKDMLEIIGIEKSKIEKELSKFKKIRFGKTQSKVVLGCQNDCIRIVSFILRDDPPSSLLENSLKLSQMPFKSIGFANPQEMTKKLFST